MARSGIVILYNDIHGNGLIDPLEPGSERIKFSYKDVVPSNHLMLCEGDKVSYELAKTDRGGIKAAFVELVV